jgi:hypothetical protein
MVPSFCVTYKKWKYDKSRWIKNMAHTEKYVTNNASPIQLLYSELFTEIHTFEKQEFVL